MGHARGAHLALVQGGRSDTIAARQAPAVLGTAPVARPTRPEAATVYHVRPGNVSPGVEAPRSSHERGVQAVARSYPNFESALLPMVLASGVSGEAAPSVARAIMANPSLRADAERAFLRARIDAC